MISSSSNSSSSFSSSTSSSSNSNSSSSLSSSSSTSSSASSSSSSANTSSSSSAYSSVPSNCKSITNSYVIPLTQAYHEEIAIAGSDITLHYSTRYTQGYAGSDLNLTVPLAQGWTLSVRHRYDGRRLLRGNGVVTGDINVTTDRNNTRVRTNGRIYIFDADGKHLRTTDAQTGTPLYAFAYNPDGTLRTVTDTYGKALTLHYDDASGHLDLITASTGQQTALVIDANHTLQSVAYEDGSAYTFDYDAEGLMLAESEPNGNVFRHLFDETGRITKVIDAEGGRRGYSSATTPQYDKQVIHYPEGGRTVYKNYPLSDGFRRSVVIYPNADRLVVRTSADERTVITKACGVTKKERYNDTDPLDGHKRLTKETVTLPSGLQSVTALHYTDTLAADGSLQSRRTALVANAHKSVVRFDKNTHTRTFISPEGRRTILTYDNTLSLPLSIKRAGLKPTAYTYDANGKVTSQRRGGRRATYAYDARGNLQSLTDERNLTTAYTYDQRDRLTRIGYPDGTQTRFAYDANGNTIRLTTPTPADNDYAYNGVNNPTAWSDPLGFVTRYSYDRQRRLTQIARPSGKTLTHTYAHGQKVQTATPERTYTYAYDCANKPATITTDDNESLAYTYDGDLLTSVTQGGLLNQSIVFEYNSDFLPKSITYAGMTKHLAYDKDGLLIQSGDATIRRDAQTALPLTVTDGTFTVHNSYNGYGEPKEHNVTVNMQQVYANHVLNRNKSGQITSRSESVNGETHIYTYRYDKRGRLKRVLKDGSVTEAYTYDANGNRLTKKRGGQKTTVTYTVADQLETVGDATYAYDADGYLASKITPEGTTHYSYGTLGELRSVVKPDGTVIEYVHNANNQRVAKKVNGTITEKYLWKDLTTLLAVYDKDDNLVQRFEYADGRMPYKMTYSGQTYYLAYDQVGTLKVVTDTNGNIVKERTYDTFGNLLSDSNATLNVPFGFAGGLYDPDTKLTRFGYRDYDAETGKWTAKDPIGFNGGDTNLYGYVLGDPVNLVDLDGKIAFLAIPWAWIAAGTGAGFTGGFLGYYAAGGNCLNAALQAGIVGAAGGAITGYLAVTSGFAAFVVDSIWGLTSNAISGVGGVTPPAPKPVQVPSAPTSP